MKNVLKEIGIALILGILLPGLVLEAVVRLSRLKQTQPPETEVSFYTQPAETPVRIRVLDRDGDVIMMELEEYITGVVLAEMPASFEPEALKAQAVVARTYAMRAEQGMSKHENAAVCMESSCCQAFRWPEEGSDPADAEKVRAAVQDTASRVLVYEGELIEATYFSCSGGSTEDAVAVWGTEVPYLVSTESPGEEKAAHFEVTVLMSCDTFLSALSLEERGEPEHWFGAVTHTAGGGVDTMEICGKTFSGTELRSLLELRSTAITMEPEGDSIRISTKGFGHRVGMSQYGADAMALGGSTYDEILAHYYRGTELQKLSH